MKQSSKEYFLMHKDIPVCLMTITEDGSISNIKRNMEASAHFPLGGQMNLIKFHEWERPRHSQDTAWCKNRHAKTRLCIYQ